MAPAASTPHLLPSGAALRSTEWGLSNGGHLFEQGWGAWRGHVGVERDSPCVAATVHGPDYKCGSLTQTTTSLSESLLSTSQTSLPRTRPFGDALWVIGHPFSAATPQPATQRTAPTIILFIPRKDQAHVFRDLLRHQWWYSRFVWMDHLPCVTFT